MAELETAFDGLMYRALIQPLRDADTTLFLQRFLQRPQEQFEALVARIKSLSDTDSPDTIPAALLTYLKDHVGFTSELDAITSRLDTVALRRLIALAVRMWKQKGTSAGLLDLIRLLTGKSAVYYDWFHYRNILGESLIGEEQLGSDNWLIGGEFTRLDEYTSHIRLMDDGTLDTTLLLDLIDLVRPQGERIEVAVLDFLDLFDADLSRWDIVGGPAIDPTTSTLLLPPSATAAPVLPIWGDAPEDQTDYTSIHKFTLGDAANVHTVRWYFRDLVTNHYRLVIAADNTLKLYHTIGGVAILLETIDLALLGVVIVAGTEYKVRIDTVSSLGTNNLIRVYIDATRVLDWTQAEPAETATGILRFDGDVANVADNVIDNVEIYRPPLRWAMVGPDGRTMTDSFTA